MWAWSTGSEQLADQLKVSPGPCPGGAPLSPVFGLWGANKRFAGVEGARGRDGGIMACRHVMVPELSCPQALSESPLQTRPVGGVITFQNSKTVNQEPS